MKTLLSFFIVIFLSFSSAKAQCSDDLLESYGGISVVAMYNTFVSIGAIADGYSNEQYDAQYVQTLMDEQIGMLTTVSDMLTKVIENDSNKVDILDKDFMSEILIAFKYLELEANALKNYSMSDSADYSAEYETNRQLAWTKIAELMGLED
jgi:hypothetical protein